MAFTKDTIKLGAAQAIFTGVDIQEIKIGDRTVGYKATLNGSVYQDAGLTSLCKALWWEAQNERQNDA